MLKKLLLLWSQIQSSMIKTKPSKIIIVAALCSSLVSCMKWGNRENSRLIQQAQLLTEQMPDSALRLLDMVNTVRFNNAERMEYTLLRVQARGLAEMDLTTDTEIFQAREYFIGRKDKEKAALACFYAGQALLAQDKVDEAVACYLEANDFASHLDDDQLKGQIANQIGRANYLLGLIDHSLPFFLQAIDFFRTAGNRRSEE